MDNLFKFETYLMNRALNNIISLLIFVLSAFNLFYANEHSTKEPWKIDIQILLGFNEKQIDGIMGKDTFEALKKFAYQHDLTDVVLRGEFNDLGFWGFQQYMVKYHQYWIRELKNRKIIEDVSNQEYIKQAEETLYSFQMAIQNAQREVERLSYSKIKILRDKKELEARDSWKQEKKEVERLITSLNKAIVTASDEAEKWSLERLRAQRLAEEQEQLSRLEERKLEASILTADLEDAIVVAKREIDRLVEENKKLKILIESTVNSKQIADQLKEELHFARMQLDSLYSRKITDQLSKELETTRFQIDSLSVRKDSLENILQSVNEEIITKSKDVKKKRKWYNWLWPFGK